MTRAEYHTLPAVNYSSLKHILTSPAHYQAALREVREETTAMRLGTMLHQWWLEGKDDVLAGCAVKPEGLSFSTKEGKAWREENQGKFILSADEWALFLKRQSALKDSKIANSILDVMPDREKALVGEIEGVPVKALFDANSTCAFLDLKTCQKNDPKSWGESVQEYHYDFQSALYAEILRQNYQNDPAFYWITVSADDSPAVVVYEPGPFRERGRDKLRRAIAAYKELQAYGEQPLVPELPYWIAAQERRAACGA